LRCTGSTVASTRVALRGVRERAALPSRVSRHTTAGVVVICVWWKTTPPARTIASMSTPDPRLGDRSLFPTLEARAYLAHAAVSPPSSAVLAAVSRCLAEYARRGLHAAIEQLTHKAELRALAAQLLGCTPAQVAFVQSTSAGVSAIARSIPFAAGQRIITFAGEFPANVTPWQLLAHERQLGLVSLPLASYERSNDEGLAALRAELERGARLVAVSAVQFQTGLRMPLRAMAELCHAHGAELFVDAIQGLGAVPLDVQAEGVDYLVAGGHKFLMGLEGAGLLYIADRALAQLSLGLAGWTGHEDAFRFLSEGPGLLRYDRPIVRSASFVEQGALSVVGLAALSASLQTLLSLGVGAIFAHVTAYLDRLEPELVALGCASVRSRDPAQRSATLSVKLPSGAVLSDVAGSMLASGVCVSTPDGHLRFAPHFANALDEVPLVARALRVALRGGG
jgi:cysteine desulfurase / selenocysteine lyase